MTPVRMLRVSCVVALAVVAVVSCSDGTKPSSTAPDCDVPPSTRPDDIDAGEVPIQPVLEHTVALAFDDDDGAFEATTILLDAQINDRDVIALVERASVRTAPPYLLFEYHSSERLLADLCDVMSLARQLFGDVEISVVDIG